MMKREMVCIVCPNGCDLTVEYQGREVLSVAGGACPKGSDYARQEIVNPERTIASLVRVIGGELPLASVRTSWPIPKDQIFPVMEQIKAVTVTAPAQINQVVIPNVLNTGADIIITKEVAAKETAQV